MPFGSNRRRFAFDWEYCSSTSFGEGSRGIFCWNIWLWDVGGKLICWLAVFEWEMLAGKLPGAAPICPPRGIRYSLLSLIYSGNIWSYILTFSMKLSTMLILWSIPIIGLRPRFALNSLFNFSSNLDTYSLYLFSDIVLSLGSSMWAPEWILLRTSLMKF